MIVRWLPRANADLDKIGAYIGRDNHAAALRVQQSIRNRADQLVEWPESAPEGRVAGTRELVAGRYPYTLVYRIHADKVEIIRVLGPGQDWPPADSAV